MILALRRPQPASDRLDKPYSRFCRPGVDNAADIEVNAGVECGDVANKLGLACAEPVKDFFTLEHSGVTVDVFRPDAGLDKALLKMLRMLTINAVAKGWTVLAFFKPCPDYIGDDFLFVARVGKIRLVEFSRLRPHAGQVRGGRCEYPEIREKAFVDQLLNRDWND